MAIIDLPVCNDCSMTWPVKYQKLCLSIVKIYLFNAADGYDKCNEKPG